MGIYKYYDGEIKKLFTFPGFKRLAGKADHEIVSG